MTIEKFKNISEVIGIWVAIVGSIAGGSFGLREYLDNKKSEQVKFTMAAWDKFNEPAIKSARLGIDDAQKVKRDELKGILRPELSRPAKNLGYYKFTLDMIEEYELADDVQTLLEFYSSVAICVSNDICDGPTARKYFGKHGLSFFTAFAPFICQERLDWRDDTIGSELGPFYVDQTTVSVCKKYEVARSSN